MLKKISQKINLQNIFVICFYGSFLTIISVCLLETITYPGIFLNKTGINLSNITFALSLIFLYSYFQLNLSKFVFKRSKTLFIFSLSTIFITLVVILIEHFTYSNFVFSKFHINYQALQTLSLFLFIFIILDLILKINLKPIFGILKINLKPIFGILKINLKPIFNNRSKILIILLLCLIPILSYFSWSQHLTKNNIISSETILLPSVRNNFIFLKDKTRIEALKDQFTWFFKTSNTYSQIKIFFNLITISFSTLFFLIAILFYLNWLQNKKSSRIGIALLFFYIGGILYSILIILISVKMFSIGELKAFQGRYILTYALALIMFSFYLFLNEFKKQKKVNLFFLFYLALLFLIINISNLVKLKPADKEFFLNRKKQELLCQKIKNSFNKKDQPIFHTIEGEGPISYRYFLAPYSVVSPIWQDWDIFMFENPAFKTATHVFLPLASTVTKKWSISQIEKIFKDKKFVVDNGLYKVVYTTKDKSSFQLELVDTKL